MAKIMKTSVQEDALKKINMNIKSVSAINSILEKEGEKGLAVTYGKSRFALPVSIDYTSGILMDVRKSIVSETRALAKKHSIMLDDTELEILDGKREPEKDENEVKPDPSDEKEAGFESSDWHELNGNARNVWEGLGDDYDD